MQADALAANDTGRFHDLDYSFHQLICQLAGLPKAFDTISACKREVDRLCVLSLANKESVDDVFDDHRAIADALSRRSVQDARASVRWHTNRLDRTIAEIHQAHAGYFQ